MLNMKFPMRRLLLPLVIVSLVLGRPLNAAAPASDAADELKQLISDVREKLKEGKKSEADLADNLKQFDALLEKHATEKTDEVAQILFMKAMLYQEVLENPEKAKAVIEQLKKDFPETKQGKNADNVLESFKKQEESLKVQRTLVPGAVFPDFNEKDLSGEPLSVARFKGKVVLVDFWATWCGPCVGELPNVLKTYKDHHAKGFEIIGISLDQDKQKLETFIKDKEMTWPQYFDGKGWQSKLAGKYGINSIPATYLLDKDGKIIAKGLRGDALEKAVAAALSKS
jgi:peroxiredoxin